MAPAKSRKIDLVAMPDWPAWEPFHSLAVVAGVASAAGWAARTHDINAELRDHVPDSIKPRWFRERYVDPHAFSEELVRRYGDWLRDRLDRLIAGAPDVIGFTVNLGTHYQSVFAGRYIREKAPHILVLFGGQNCFPGETHAEYLRGDHAGACDLVCQGEAELALRRFLDEYDRTETRFPATPGFLYLRDGTLVDTGPAPLPDLKRDICRDDFSGFDLGLYLHRGSLPFQFSRGCPFRCRFCNSVNMFPKFRVRDPAEAFEAVRDLAALATARGDRFYLRMTDLTFNANVPEMLRFLELIIEGGLDLTWRAMVHIHPQMTTRVLERMRLSGCICLFWGIESASQRVVDAMRKNYRVEDAVRVIRDCSRLGITQQIPILVGFPGEQPEDAVKSIVFILEYRFYPKVKLHQPSLLKIFPNSPLGGREDGYRLTGPGPDDWETTDGRNTLPVRRLRLFVLRNAQMNEPLSRERLAEAGTFAALDLNDPQVSRECRDLVGGLFEAAGIADWAALLPESLGDPDGWAELDMNAPDRREGLIQAMLQAMRLVQEDRFRRVEEDPALPLLRPVLDGTPLTRLGTFRGWLDRAERDGDEVVVAGWAFDAGAPARPVEILVYCDRKLAARHTPTLRRSDVAAEHGEAATTCGFEFRIPRERLEGWNTLFVVNSQGEYGFVRGNFWQCPAL